MGQKWPFFGKCSPMKTKNDLRMVKNEFFRINYPSNTISRKTLKKVVFSNFFCRFTPLRTQNPGSRFWPILRFRWSENRFLGRILCWGLKDVIRGNWGRRTRCVHLELAKHFHFRALGPKKSKIGHFWQNKGWTYRFLPIFESDPKLSIFRSVYKRKKSVSRVIWVR